MAPEKTTDCFTHFLLFQDSMQFTMSPHKKAKSQQMKTSTPVTIGCLSTKGKLLLPWISVYNKKKILDEEKKVSAKQQRLSIKMKVKDWTKTEIFITSAASYWPCLRRIDAIPIVELEEMGSLLLPPMIELQNFLTEPMNSQGLGKDFEHMKYCPSLELGKSSKQANVKSEEPRFSSKDLLSALLPRTIKWKII